MFDIGWGELLLIGIVALIAIGPKELPGALRTLGQWMGKIRRMAADFQNQFNEAMREAEMADLKRQVETLTSGFDPIGMVRKEVEAAMEDKPAGPRAPDASGAGNSDAAAATATEAVTEAPSAKAADASLAPADETAPPAEVEPPAEIVPVQPPAAETEEALRMNEPSNGKPGDRPA